MYKPDKLEERAIEKRKEVTLNLIEPQAKRKKVLEIGPGTGSLLLELKKKGFSVVGIDINPALARKAGLRIKKWDINKGLPFRNSSFDIVIALEVLEHTFDPFFVMKEIKRILKPKGYAIISMPNEYCLSNKIAILLSRPQKDFDIYGHHYFLGLDQIRFLVSKELKIVKEIPLLFFRKFRFFNPLAKFFVKINKSLFARNLFIKAVKE